MEIRFFIDGVKFVKSHVELPSQRFRRCRSIGTHEGSTNIVRINLMLIAHLFETEEMIINGIIHVIKHETLHDILDTCEIPQGIQEKILEIFIPPIEDDIAIPLMSHDEFNEKVIPLYKFPKNFGLGVWDYVDL